MIPSSPLAIKDGTVGSLAGLGVEPVGVGVVGCLVGLGEALGLTVGVRVAVAVAVATRCMVEVGVARVGEASGLAVRVRVGVATGLAIGVRVGVGVIP